jgi:hypothetical protein
LRVHGLGANSKNAVADAIRWPRRVVAAYMLALALVVVTSGMYKATQGRGRAADLVQPPLHGFGLLSNAGLTSLDGQPAVNPTEPAPAALAAVTSIRISVVIVFYTTSVDAAGPVCTHRCEVKGDDLGTRIWHPRGPYRTSNDSREQSPESDQSRQRPIPAGAAAILTGHATQTGRRDCGHRATPSDEAQHAIMPKRGRPVGATLPSFGVSARSPAAVRPIGRAIP